MFKLSFDKVQLDVLKLRECNKMNFGKDFVNFANKKKHRKTLVKLGLLTHHSQKFNFLQTFHFWRRFNYSQAVTKYILY